MKLKIVVAALLFGQLLFSQVNSQLGIKGGISLTFFNQSDGGNFGFDQKVVSEVYGGFFMDFEINEEFHLQPELLYIGLGDFKFLNAPIYAKYDIAEFLSLAVGPSLNYFFDFFVNKFKVRGDLNTAFHITESLDFNIKYTLGFEEFSPNVLFVGLGYKL